MDEAADDDDAPRLTVAAVARRLGVRLVAEASGRSERGDGAVQRLRRSARTSGATAMSSRRASTSSSGNNGAIQWSSAAP